MNCHFECFPPGALSRWCRGGRDSFLKMKVISYFGFTRQPFKWQLVDQNALRNQEIGIN